MPRSLLAIALLGLVAKTHHAQTAGFSESELPIVVIGAAYAEIPDEPKATTTLRVIDNGPGVTNRLDGPTRDYDGPAAVELRGQTSLRLFPKQGFAVELRARDGADSSAAILGMPAEEDWVLHGPYSDKSLIRNAFTYTLARELMDYAPRTRLVELVLDTAYWGVYLLTERIKRDGDRVDVAKLNPDETAGDDLTGGYILKFDKTDGQPIGEVGFELPAVGLPGARPSRISLHYPRPDRIAPEQKAYIRDWLRDFERRLSADDFDDPDRGYLPLVDLGSIVDFLLVNEVTRNVDGYRISTYFHKERDSDGGRLRMGPVWDFNLALANAEYCRGSDEEGWAFAFNEVCPDDGFYMPFWYPRLVESAAFRVALRERYTALRQNGGPLSDARLRARVDSLTAALTPAAVARNFERWDGLGEWTWPNSFVPDSHDEAVEHLKDWLEARMAWLDGAVAGLTDTSSLPIAVGRPLLYPNPGAAGPRVVVPDGWTYPVRATWVDAAGRRGATVELTGPAERVAPPAASGVYALELVGAGGRTAVVRWVGL